MRHVIGSGFFCERGVKKFAAAFSVDAVILISSLSAQCGNRFLVSLVTVVLLVTVAVVLFSGGGEIARVGDAARFVPPIPAILSMKK